MTRKRPRRRLFRRAAAIGACALAITAATAVPASAATEPIPSFDFSDCPALPAGANPAEWRCEVLVSRGTLSFGRADNVELPWMRLTFAERNGARPYQQVFGALRAQPSRIPGTPWRIEPRYAGYSDFQANDQRKGEIDLGFALHGPPLGPDCRIGDERNPVHNVVKQVGKNEVVSTDPLVVRFRLVDDQLAFPAAHGCGLFDRLVDHRLGLPTTPGTARYEQTVHVSMRGY